LRCTTFLIDDDDYEDPDVVNADLWRPEADDYSPEAFDAYLRAEIQATRGDTLLRGTVVSRKRDRDGLPTGCADPNPLLDTREYLVCFEDGSEDIYTANLIAESLYLHVDDAGRRLQTSIRNWLALSPTTTTLITPPSLDGSQNEQQKGGDSWSNGKMA
jgi:hypothetical protein